MRAQIHKLKVEDLIEVLKESPNSYLSPELSEEQKFAIESSPHTYSITAEGHVLACGGITEYWSGRAECWIVFSAHVRDRFLEISNLSKRVLWESPIRRIEAAVACDFKQGHRWMKLLGFSLECPRMKAFLPDGKDAAMYVRVK